MEALWPYVTPRLPGLDKPESLVLGCRSFALSGGACSRGDPQDPRRRENRPSPAACRDFLIRALDADCPVAFLNFSNGSLPNLDSWHWVPLIALTEGGGGPPVHHPGRGGGEGHRPGPVAGDHPAGGRPGDPFP